MNTKHLLKLANELNDLDYSASPKLKAQVQEFIDLPCIEVTSELSIEDCQYEALEASVCLELTREQTNGLYEYMEINDINPNDFRQDRNRATKLTTVWMA